MRKNTIRVIVITAAFTAILLAMTPFKKPVLKESPCQESMEECCKKELKNGTDNMIMETLSGQFFTFSGVH